MAGPLSVLGCDPTAASVSLSTVAHVQGTRVALCVDHPSFCAGRGGRRGNPRGRTRSGRRWFAYLLSSRPTRLWSASSRLLPAATAFGRWWSGRRCTSACSGSCCSVATTTPAERTMSMPRRTPVAILSGAECSSGRLRSAERPRARCHRRSHSEMLATPRFPIW
jgi:hypothetical protein